MSLMGKWVSLETLMQFGKQGKCQLDGLSLGSLGFPSLNCKIFTNLSSSFIMSFVLIVLQKHISF